MITTEGKNHILDSTFNAAADTYIGLFDGEGAAGDTLASHAGWTEITAYTGNRKACVCAAADAGSVTNSANPASFSMDDTYTVDGAFVGTAETGTSGQLISVTAFTTPRSGGSGDTIQITQTYTWA